MTIRSTISTKYLRRTLWQGTAFALIGACAIVFGGVFLPPSQLGGLGLPLFLVGMGIITLGLLPSRRLRKLETNPYEIRISTDEKWLEIFRGEKQLVAIAKETIKDISYKEDSNCYGIILTLSENLKENVVLNSLEGQHLMNRGYCKQNNTLFLPYFSQRGCTALQNEIKFRTEEYREV